jgi:secreted Zn-dependent insulinase-like peptidase
MCDRAAILKDFTYEDFKYQLGRWLKNGRAMWFIYGNLSEEASIEIVEDARTKINLNAVAKEQLRAVRHIKLPNGESCRLDFEVPDEKNDNSCTMTYFQGGQSGDAKTTLLTMLMAQYIE